MRRTFMLFFLFPIIWAGSIHGQECRYKQALEAYQQSDYAAAISDFDAVANDPAACEDVQLSDIYYWRGWCHYHLGHEAQALADFEQAVNSPTNGLTAQYIRVLLARLQKPNDIPFLRQSINDLDVLISRSGISPTLKDKALFLRSLLRLQLGELLYKSNQISMSENYFRGIVIDEEEISNRNMSELNEIVRSSALAWLLHETLSQKSEPDEPLIEKAAAINLPLAEDDPDDKRELVIYYQSLLKLFTYLLNNDYNAFQTAKNAMLSLDSSKEFVASFRATINLLEENYNAVLNAQLGSTPFDNYRKGWARLLRNNQSEADLRRAQELFNNSRQALPKCQSPLRKASAFRYMQAKHLRDWQSSAMQNDKLSQFFLQECLDDEEYEARREIWKSILEASWGFIPGNCLTGQGFLELGLYRGLPDLVDQGKEHLSANKCEFIQDDLVRAILLCTGQNPDFEQAIIQLQKLMTGAGEDIDEVRYALAMAYYNNGKSESAIPLLNDLAEKGSLDACYKLAAIYKELGEVESSCRYLGAIIQRQNTYTIYRKDAMRLYGMNQCSALGLSAKKITAESSITLRWPEYEVFAYDYIGQGVGIIAKLYYEMKNEIVKFITPQISIDFYNLDLLVPEASLTAYINLSVVSPLPSEPELTISLNEQVLPDINLQRSGNSYIFKSGPLDMGDFEIVVKQKGSYGWMYRNFISGNFDRHIVLDSAFVLQTRPAPSFDNLHAVSQIVQSDGRLAAFTPYSVIVDGSHYKLPPNIDVVNSAVAVEGEYYCLIAEKNQVVRISLLPPDSTAVETFIRGVYDPKADIPDYRDGLQKPMKILFNGAGNVFYILNSSGDVFEFNRDGHCINRISSPGKFIIDVDYDAAEKCLWFLDVSGNMIHKYEIGAGFNENETKIIDDVQPLYLLTDAAYFYLVDANSDIHLHKKSNFRRLNIFAMPERSDNIFYTGFAMAGANSKKIIAVRKHTSENKIWTDDIIQVLQGSFDPDFEGAVSSR